MKRVMRSTLLFMVFLLNTALAQNTPSLSLESGLWEGISDANGISYYLLQLNDNGEHKLIIANLASAFRYRKRLTFSTRDISCTPSECVLNIPHPRNQNKKLRLIITPHLDDSFKVLEMYIDDQNKPILTSTYQLDKKKGKSTVSAFIERYREKLLALDDSTDELIGMWIGVANIRGKKQLVVLDYNYDERSDFVLMINGSSFVNETHFNKNDVSVVDGVTKISTTHATFANQILLHQLTEGMLQGQSYSYYKGKVMEPFDFLLYKIKK